MSSRYETRSEQAIRTADPVYLRKAILACRKCPLHQDPFQPNPINNRPEDFLATDVQKNVCDEALHRSFACRWDNVAASSSPYARGDASGSEEDRFDRESTPQNSHDLDILDTIAEQDVQADQIIVEAPANGASPWLSRPLGTLIANQRAQITIN